MLLRSSVNTQSKTVDMLMRKKMKTLDEVVKALKCEVSMEHISCSDCAYYDDDPETVCRTDDIIADALQYLLEYKEMLINVENDSLDWYELKLMKGKPIWVEADDGKYKGWFIVGNFFSWFEKEDFDAHVNLYRSGSAMEMSKENYGFYWQAYRKERKE